MTRKSKPWAVVIATPDGPFRTEHRSQPEAYRRVNAVRTQVLAGEREVSRIRVEQWEPACNDWALYDLIDPKEQ